MCEVVPITPSPETCGKISFSATQSAGEKCQQTVYGTSTDALPADIDALLVNSIEDAIRMGIDPDYVYNPTVNPASAVATVTLSGGTLLVIDFVAGTITYDGNPVTSPTGTFTHGGDTYTITINTSNNTLVLSSANTGLVFTSANGQIGSP